MHPLVHVKPMRRGSDIGGDSRVEVKLGAAKSSRLGHHPVEKCTRVTLPAEGREAGEIVAVQSVIPGEKVCRAEAGDRRGFLYTRDEGANEAIALRTLKVVDPRHKFGLRTHIRSQLEHGGIAVRVLGEDHMTVSQALYEVWDVLRRELLGYPAVVWRK